MNWHVFTHLSTIQVQLHWLTAVLAFLVGIVIFSLKKGSTMHRNIGRFYVSLMALTCVSAFFVRTGQHGEEFQWFSGLSFIHLLIPVTVVMITRAIVAIRRGDVVSHKSNMIGAFVGGLLIAGAFTFLPHRHMYDLFFASEQSIRERVESGIKK